MARINQLSIVAAFISSALFMSANVEAAQPGFYLGGQGGWGNVNEAGISHGDMNALISSALGYSNYTMATFNGTTSGNGAAWRVFGGYQWNYNWATEIGWAIYPNLPIHATATGIDQNTGLPYTAEASGTFKTPVFDIVGKYIVPLPCHMNVYGKFGFALITGYSDEYGSVSETGLLASADANNKETTVYPTFGVGLSYDFRPDISGDIAYNRIQKVGNSDQIGSIDFVSVSLALYFG